jgi:hypothetical protein
MQKQDQLKNQVETMETLETLEIYENKKILAFKGLIVSFIAWQLGQIMMNNFSELMHSSVIIVFSSLNFIGAVGWAGFIFYLIKISRFLKGNSNLNSQINDERMSLIRLRAMSYGFVITLGATSLFYGASTLVDTFSVSFELPGTFIAQSIILIAVSSVLISYLILDKSE